MRLLSKVTFLPRQRAAINYSHKYVLTDKDVMGKQSTNENEKILKEKIMVGFDPENNEQDRRILYEVMGMRIYRGEFH